MTNVVIDIAFSLSSCNLIFIYLLILRSPFSLSYNSVHLSLNQELCGRQWPTPCGWPCVSIMGSRPPVHSSDASGLGRMNSRGDQKKSPGRFLSVFCHKYVSTSLLSVFLPPPFHSLTNKKDHQGLGLILGALEFGHTGSTVPLGWWLDHPHCWPVPLPVLIHTAMESFQKSVSMYKGPKLMLPECGGQTLPLGCHRMLGADWLLLEDLPAGSALGCGMNRGPSTHAMFTISSCTITCLKEMI